MIRTEISLIFLLSILLFVSLDISSHNHIVLGKEDSKSSDDDDTREKGKQHDDGDKGKQHDGDKGKAT